MDNQSTTTQKRCSKCGETFPATPDYFYRNKTRPGGLHHCCKTCQAALARIRHQSLYEPENLAKLMQHRLAACERSRKYHTVHPEKRREIQRRYRASQPQTYRECKQRYNLVHPEKKREHDRKYWAANRDKLLERKRRYYVAHAERHNAYARQYRAAHPEKRREWNRLRKLLLRAAGKVTKEDLAQIWMAQNGCCAYCQHPLDSIYHVEHIRPISRGGTNAVNNLCMSCPKCNLSKGTKMPEEWTNRWYENQPDES